MTNGLKAIFLRNDIINDRSWSNLGRFGVQSFKGRKWSATGFLSLIFATHANCMGTNKKWVQTKNTLFFFQSTYCLLGSVFMSPLS